jgi:DNA-binding HxlR family transcriptional regulator
MHERTSHYTSNCSIARCLEIMGEKWTFLVLREAFYGVTRFADLERILGCPRNLLADRLHLLVENGILAKKPYKDPGERTRSEYVLTAKGDRLIPALIAILEWGDEYLTDPNGPAVFINHRGCDHPVQIEMRCVRGHKIRAVDDLEILPGPGFRLASSGETL